MTNTTDAAGSGTNTGTATSTTSSNGQPGFGILTGVGGLAGLGAALRAKFGDEE